VRSQSNGLAHRVGTRDIVWLLATLSVQLYFPCTPSPQGVEGSTTAANLLGLSQSPFPLFLPQVLFSLCPRLGLAWKPAAGPDAGRRLRLTPDLTYAYDPSKVRKCKARGIVHKDLIQRFLQLIFRMDIAKSLSKSLRNQQVTPLNSFHNCKGGGVKARRLYCTLYRTYI